MTSASDYLNRPAPNFTLPILGGGRFSPVAQRGKIMVLTFWSAECPWSRRADVVLVYRQLAWKAKSVVTVGIAANLDEPENEIRYEADIRRVNYPLLLDPRQQAVDLYKAETTPHFYIIDRQGIIRYIGALDDASSQQREAKVIYVDQAVKALLEERSPEPGVTAAYGCSIARERSERGVS